MQQCYRWPVVLSISKRSRGFVFAASRFKSILDHESLTTSTFKGLPLAALDSGLRGEVLAAVVRRIDSDLHPKALFDDAIQGTCINGRRRSPKAAEYDWSRNGQRVECKSSQLQWVNSTERWKFQFSSIKLARMPFRAKPAFDDLLLALYTPRSLYIYRHDTLLGVTLAGKRTEAHGHSVQFNGPRRESNWALALDSMLSMLDMSTNSCERIAELPLDDGRIQKVVVAKCSFLEDFYEGVPLAHLNFSARGLRIEALVRAVDTLINSDSVITDALVGYCVNGSLRGQHQAEYDWMRDKQRIECKSSQLYWDRSNVRWMCRFANVRGVHTCTKVQHEPAFDELLLALYTPSGVYIYRHNPRHRLGLAGLATESKGFVITFVGPRSEYNWDAALANICTKIEQVGCVRVAQVMWD